ncbi:FAD/NAD(P)-binding domain-containing protein [Cyathus striatus]|nr:FAD/NAD(P)-binding domain-containing protein [Cyathus striatus]
MAQRKTILILGGGHAGISLSKRLCSQLNPEKYTVLLINTRPFSIWYPAMVRIVTKYDSEIEGRAYLPYDKMFKEGMGKVVVGEVCSIRKNEDMEVGGKVVLKTGEEICFDVLVLAMGSIRRGPFSFGNTLEEMETQIREQRKAVKAARRIVLFGGGAVAIEYAGEIKDAYPRIPAKFRDMVESDLRARGVGFMLGDVVESFTKTSVTCRSGKEVTADIVIQCNGSQPNTQILHLLDPKTLTSSGHVRVTPHLQLSDHRDIFALGDIIDYPEQKQAGKVHDQAAIVANNISCFLEGIDKGFREYRGSYEILVLTNGKNGGSSYFGLLGGWSFGAGKSRNLLIPFARRLVGLLD